MSAPWTRDHTIRGERTRLKSLKRLARRNPLDSRIKKRLTDRITYVDIAVEIHGRPSHYVVMKQIVEEFDEYSGALDEIEAAHVGDGLDTP